MKELLKDAGVRGGEGKVVLITGYFNPATKDIEYGHAMYFEQQAGLLFDPVKKEWSTASGNLLGVRHDDSKKAQVVFGSLARADHELPACQVTECEITYEFFGMLVCGIIGLLTGGFGLFLCEMVWQPLVKYVCHEVIYPYCP